MEAEFTGEEFRHVTFVPGISVLPPPIHKAGARWLHNAAAASQPAGDQSDRSLVDPFLAWLLQRGGLNDQNYRPAPLERRLPACLRALRVRRPDEARALLERRPDLLPVALGAVLIGVTSFFRDAEVFDVLERQVLPDLVRERRSLACWSAGCSEGAELYSLAIMLAKLGVLHKCVLHGTDCRPSAIAKARKGAYRVSDLQAFAPEIRGAYFVAQGHGLATLPLLRQATSWSVADVLETHMGGSWDLILCRNLAIYLQPAAARRLWTGMYESLRPGGILVVGRAEHPPGRKHWKKLAGSIFQKMPRENRRPAVDFVAVESQESRHRETVALTC